MITVRFCGAIRRPDAINARPTSKTARSTYTMIAPWLRYRIVSCRQCDGGDVEHDAISRIDSHDSPERDGRVAADSPVLTVNVDPAFAPDRIRSFRYLAQRSRQSVGAARKSSPRDAL